MASPYDQAEDSPSQSVGPITSAQNARNYLDAAKVPELLRSLMAGLMVSRPKDPYLYLDNKLEEIKLRGLENINWESFVYDLHPSRDPLHCTLIKDDKTREEKVGFAPYDEYKPSLFKLTEPIE